MTSSKFQGVTCTREYLTVSFVRDVGGSKRFEQVKVPLVALVDDEVLYCIYKAAAQALRLAWEDNGEVIPLFEV